MAAHGRHEDPDVRGGGDVHAAAAVGAVEKVCVPVLLLLLQCERSCHVTCRFSWRLLQNCPKATMKAVAAAVVVVVAAAAFIVSSRVGGNA